jgi:hypothetical protein
MAAMHPELTAIAGRQGGVFLRRQALATDYSEDEVNRKVRLGEWRRVRRGAYVEADVISMADGRARHLLAMHAFIANSALAGVACDVTAALVLGMGLWRPDLTTVHLVREGASGRREAGICHHNVALATDEITHVGGVAVTTAARTAYDLARRLSYEEGVVACDSALRVPETAIEDLRRIHLRYDNWAGARRARRAIDAADGRAQNPGESLARVALARIGYGDAEPQVVVRLADGTFVAMTDFYIARICTVVEFDGAMKYGIDGQDPRQQVIEEKRREDRLRDCGLQVVRMMAADLRTLDTLHARIEGAAQRGRGSTPRCRFESSPPDLWHGRAT